MTLAAVDRIVHHATIFEMNVDSYRRREALARKKPGAGRPANYATTKNVGALTPSGTEEKNAGSPTTSSLHSRPSPSESSHAPESST